MISTSRNAYQISEIGREVFEMKIGYTRVSTSSQRDDLQRDALLKEGCEKIFSDVSTGTTLLNRPGLNAAMAYVRPGDELVFFKLDRLGRNSREVLSTIDALNKAGIEFRSLTENLETTSSSGRFFLQVTAAICEIESSTLRERVRAGLQASRDRGTKLGRPAVLVAEKRAMAESLLRDGAMSVPQIAAELKIGVATLYRSFPGGKAAVQGR